VRQFDEWVLLQNVADQQTNLGLHQTNPTNTGQIEYQPQLAAVEAGMSPMQGCQPCKAKNWEILWHFHYY